MTEIESLQAGNAALRAEVRQARATARSLAHELESHETAAQGPEAVAKETRRLQALIRTVEATADQWRQTVRVLERERFVLRRKAGQR